MNEPNNNQPINGGMNFNTPNVNPQVPNVQGMAPNANLGQQPVMNNVGQANVIPNGVVNEQVPMGSLNVNPNPQVNVPSPVASAQPLPTMNNQINNGQQPVNNNVMPPVTDNQMMMPNATQELPKEDMPSEKPKKKGSPIIVIFLIMILLAGVTVGYYFFLETPEKIFGGAFDKLMAGVNDNSFSSGFVNYSLKLKIDTENKQYKVYSDVINNINISGTSGYNADSKKINTKNKILYKNKQLLDFAMLVDIPANTSYVKLNDLFDKVLMMKNDETGESVTSMVNTNVSDYITLKNAFTEDVKKTLEAVDYKKELVALDGSRVTKTTLFINDKFMNTLYDYLLQDSSYINSYAKVSGMTVEEVKEELNKDKTTQKVDDEKIIIYTSLIKNDFLKLELLSSDMSFMIRAKENSYSYEYREKEEVMYNGTVTLTKNDKDNEVAFTLTMPEESVNLGFTLTYTEVSKMDELDITNAVNINDLTDEETNAITTKLMGNEAFTQLFKDLGLEDDSTSSLSVGM